MSTTDKTGEKLVDSMRKTKASAASDKTGAAQNEAQGTQTTEPPPQAKKKSAGKRPSGTVGARVRDPYQAGRRIWPD